MALSFTATDVAQIAKLCLGEPNKRLSSKSDLRFGNHGSMCVSLDKLTWFDNEAKEGGGILDLIARTQGPSGREAVEWLRQHGFHVDDEPPQRVNGAPRNGAHHAPRPKLTATFDYTDETGDLLFQVCRFESAEIGKDGKREKTFRQRRPDPASEDGWNWKVQGVRQVPFLLPDLIGWVGGDFLVFIAEGEKAVGALRAIGAPATCNAGGAGKWPDAITPFFAGADVVILPDNDEPGRKHRDLVASKLKGVARRVTSCWRVEISASFTFRSVTVT